MKNKKIVIGLVILAVIVTVFGVWAYSRNTEPSAVEVKTQALTRGDLQKTVAINGQIASTTVEQVSNMTNIPVWDIDVSVGNWVEKGDRLCRLYSEQGDKWESVYAPVSGTITAVNAVSGAPANGALFTIEDTNSLKVVANIKEANVGTITTSMPVSVKTDATGDKVYTGKVDKIAPTAVKAVSDKVSASGASGSQNPEFQTEISLDSDITGLLIGMKARVNVITEERQGVYNIPYDLLTVGDNGEKTILVADNEKDGVFTVTAIPVTTGIETDFAVEISGDQLTDNMNVITDTTKVKAGDMVRLQTSGEQTNGQK